MPARGIALYVKTATGVSIAINNVASTATPIAIKKMVTVNVKWVITVAHVTGTVAWDVPQLIVARTVDIVIRAKTDITVQTVTIDVIRRVLHVQAIAQTVTHANLGIGEVTVTCHVAAVV